MLTISISLVAVFIPLLLMGGIVGRLFREFAVTLSAAIVVSMVVSLTATPMMCAHLLRQHESHGWMYRTSERAFNWVVNFYGRTLATVLRFPAHHPGGVAGHDCAQRLPIHSRAQGVLSRSRITAA